MHDTGRGTLCKNVSQHNIDRLTVHDVVRGLVVNCRRRRLEHVTSALSLTAGCQWPTTWRQSVAQHTIHLRQIRSTLHAVFVT